MPQGETLPGVEMTKVVFKGARHQTLNMDFKRGDEHAFVVKGIITGVGEKTMKDGHGVLIVDLDVTDIRPTSYTEPEPPEDPNQPKLVD